MRRRGPGLRAQLAIAMLGCVLVTVAMAVGATLVAMRVADERLGHALSDGAARAKKEMDEGRPPNDPRAAREVIDAQALAYSQSGAIDVGIVLAVAAASVAVGSLVAVFLGDRLGRQLEAVSQAANKVAGGDLAARAEVRRGTAGEVLRLTADFNTMAEALQGAQRHRAESFAAIAHELRTPLAIVHGRLQGIHEGIFSGEKADIAALIRQVEALGRIVSDLTVISLGAAGRLPIAAGEVDLSDIVAGLMAELRPLLEGEGFAIDLDLDPAPARADAGRIRQAVLAMVENVRRHAGAGRAIRVETRRQEAGAAISVLDRGPGLTAAAIERAFEPFWRPDESRSRDSGGSGLGLSVVAAIAAAHGGSVVAAVRDGGGAVLTLRLPDLSP